MIKVIIKSFLKWVSSLFLGVIFGSFIPHLKLADLPLHAFMQCFDRTDLSLSFDVPEESSVVEWSGLIINESGSGVLLLQDSVQDDASLSCIR